MKVAISIIVILIIAFGICLLLLRRHYAKLLDKATKRAKKSEHLKSMFIDNISRTLRAPLKAMTGFCDNLKEEKQPEQVNKLVADIANYTNDLSEYVAQLHEMAKFEGDNATFTAVEVNVGELIASYRREALNFTKPEVTVRVTTDTSPHFRAILDTNLMHQLMMHLLKNAANHVILGDIIINYGCERGGLKVAISYTGETQADVVGSDIYTLLQKEDALKDPSKHSVLGLAICRSIVDMFGGEFLMYADKEKKVIASFWFPCELKDIYRDL